MSRLYLVRHGEPASGWGEAGGDPDPGLTPLGLSQAEVVAERLAQTDAAVAHIVCSPLRRCRETAAPFARRTGLTVEIDPAVAEVPTPADLGGPARQPWLRAAMAGRWDAMQGIDGLAWRSSVVHALLREQDAAVFTHFVAINAAVGAALGSEAVLACRPAPGSITVLRAQGGRLHLEQLGEQLPGEGRVL